MSRTREERAAIAKDAAARVERATGTPAALTYVWILWALEDADAELEYGVVSYSTGRVYAEAVAIPVVLLLVLALFVWCWP